MHSLTSSSTLAFLSLLALGAGACSDGSGDPLAGTGGAFQDPGAATGTATGTATGSATGAATGTATGAATGTATGTVPSPDGPFGSDVSEVPAPAATGFGRTITGAGDETGFAFIDLTMGDAHYAVQTNPWGGSTQRITAGGGSVFEVTEISHPDEGEPWQVHSFPSVYKGTPNGGYSTMNSGLPIALSQIAAVNTGMKTNAVGEDYQGNATYDVYFTHAEDYKGGGPDVYLMVWFDGKGLNPINGDDEGWSCRTDAPDYIDSCSDAGDLTVHGKTFHRFFGPNGAAKVISYVPATVMGEFEFDLNAFIQDSIRHGVLSEDMYLQGVQAGFEIANRGTGLAIDDFYIDVVSK